MRIVIGALFLSAVLVASVQERQPRQTYDQAITESLRLQVTVTYAQNRPETCYSTLARVLLVDRRDVDHPVEIATIADDHEIAFAVERADARSVVLSRSSPDHGVDQGSIKLFVDVSTMRLLKRIDYDGSRRIEFADDAEAARTLGVTSDAVRQLRQRASSPRTLASHHCPRPSMGTRCRSRPIRNSPAPARVE
jgi:hypothetical protein